MQVAWDQVPKALSELFYALELFISGMLLTNIFQWTYSKALRSRSGTHWEKWGPVYYVGFAVPTSIAMPFAVVLVYIGDVGYPGSKMWEGGSWFPNTPLGIFMYVLRFLGTISFMIGVIQIVDLHTKIRAKWAEIRGTATKTTLTQANTNCDT
mmetsp:Transcript_1733/g.3839  ORF Transcript_1733/g.3839 Transcript_1733/m.3839 type:complete len:153 (-) Transcript_1733:606-1064(-)